jgi:hypothetical protein
VPCWGLAADAVAATGRPGLQTGRCNWMGGWAGEIGSVPYAG